MPYVSIEYYVCLERTYFGILNVILVFDGEKFPSPLVLEEAGTDTVSPAQRAYGFVCVT